MGTTAALAIAAQRPVAGLILQNPPPLRQMLLRQFGWWNLWLLAGPLARKIPTELDSIGNARAAHAPAIFLLAEEDEVVAPRYQALVVKAYAGEKRIIHLPGASHNSVLDEAGLTKLHEALDWLLRRETGQPENPAPSNRTSGSSSLRRGFRMSQPSRHTALEKPEVVPDAEGTQAHVDIGERDPEKAHPGPEHVAAIEAADTGVTPIAGGRF